MTDVEAHGTYVWFDQIGKSKPDAKTQRWVVRALRDQTALGMVRWYPGWRCYAFYPCPETIFEKKCLRDIALFCESQTHFQKQRSKPIRIVGS